MAPLLLLLLLLLLLVPACLAQSIYDMLHAMRCDAMRCDGTLPNNRNKFPLGHFFCGFCNIISSHHGHGAHTFESPLDDSIFNIHWQRCPVLLYCTVQSMREVGNLKITVVQFRRSRRWLLVKKMSRPKMVQQVVLFLSTQRMDELKEKVRFGVYIQYSTVQRQFTDKAFFDDFDKENLQVETGCFPQTFLPPTFLLRKKKVVRWCTSSVLSCQLWNSSKKHTSTSNGGGGGGGLVDRFLKWLAPFLRVRTHTSHKWSRSGDSTSLV